MHRKKAMMQKQLLVLLPLFWLLTACAQPSLLTPGLAKAEINGDTIWYHVVGDGNSTPILMLHGGPGGTSYSMYALSPLADDYTLILFDQVGTGRSGNLQDTSLMRMDYFVDQLHAFVESLGLKDYIVYGHSWGTMLALDYYLEHPEGIQAMIMNSPLVSTDYWMKDADTLIATLPDTVQQIIKKSNAEAQYDSPEYQYAKWVHYKNFISRGERVAGPDSLKRVPGNRLMYLYMWGPSEFRSTGTLQDYDRLDRLNELVVPVLWITGEYDEARPATVKYFHTLDPGSDFAVIPDAGHGTMHDNQADNVRLIRDFLGKHGW
ncbi:MAG: proline iminopeptidase-family hydrolase [Bacteroidales bacterium]|nr:proline iminopeptidase-family hydrolase [Bacteroidales bacterium]